MIQCSCNLVGKLSAKGSLAGKLNNTVVKEYPELEDLIVTPSTEQQTFKSSKYGYDNVTVKGIETEELNITPSAEEQIKEGIFNKVTVAGDSDLVPENIKEGTEIFGVTGTAEIRGEENAVVSMQPESGTCSYLLKKLPQIDFSKITSMSSFFSGYQNLESVSMINTSNITTLYRAFYNCRKLKNVYLPDTLKITNMESAFYYCKELINVHFSDTSNVTNMKSIFEACTNLETIENFDTSKVTTLSTAFASCYKIKSLKLNTSNVTELNLTFYQCTSLETISLLDCSKVTNVNFMFSYASELKNLEGLKDLGKSYTLKYNNNSSYKIDLSYSSKLTHESLMNIINNLYDLNLTYNVAGGGTLYTQQLVLGSTNKAKLTAEEIAIATNKGWTVS